MAEGFPESKLPGVTRGVMLVVSVINMVIWLTQPSPPSVAGAFLGVVLLVKWFRARNSAVAMLVMYLILALGGWMACFSAGAVIFAVHTLWVVIFFTGMLIRGDLGAGGGLANKWSQNAARKAEIERNRRTQLAYAERIEREQKYQAHATRSGPITGYEPTALTSIDLNALRPEHMYGDPGVGLNGSDFVDAAVKRGVEGEVGFAKSLAKSGLLGRFATFWSVQMPDVSLGAHSTFDTDIDCVIVTGRAIWLIDVKNYNQGDVTWQTEQDEDPQTGAPTFHLIAIDNVRGGLVGGRRRMSLNMKMATDIFTHRFSSTGIRLPLRPAVVLMPRDDGLGIAKDVRWAGGIPTAGLPDLLHWLSSEPPFNPQHPDAAIILAVLKPLLKDASGSAPKPGEIKPRNASPAAAVHLLPLPAPVPPATPASPPPPAAAVAPPVATAEKVCPECRARAEVTSTFCLECGASL